MPCLETEDRVKKISVIIQQGIPMSEVEGPEQHATMDGRQERPAICDTGGREAASGWWGIMYGLSVTTVKTRS